MNQRLLVLLRVVVAVCVSLTTLSLSARNHEAFQSGKLLVLDSDERFVQGTSFTYAIYQVQVGDIVYFGRGERLKRHYGDPGHGPIVGDPVQVAIDGDSLILQRPDGKEIKAKIIKRQRTEAK